jgi:hypothetical protein
MVTSRISETAKKRPIGARVSCTLRHRFAPSTDTIEGNRMGLTKPQAAPIDSAEYLIQNWPTLRHAPKVIAAWLHIWFSVLGGKPGSVTVHQAEIGKAVDPTYRDPSKSGKLFLRRLKFEKAFAVSPRVKGEKKGLWTIHVEHPRVVQEALRQDGAFRRVEPDPQGELFEDGSEPGAPEELPEELPVGDLLGVFNPAQPQKPNPNSPTGSSSGNRLDDPAYALTADGLTDLWIQSSVVTYNGRKRDRKKDIKPQVEATLKAGIPPEVMAAGMRDRENVLEFYNEFHGRMLREKKGKHHGDRNNRSAGRDAGDFDPTRDYPRPGGDGQAGFA